MSFELDELTSIQKRVNNIFLLCVSAAYYI